MVVGWAEVEGKVQNHHFLLLTNRDAEQHFQSTSTTIFKMSFEVRIIQDIAHHFTLPVRFDSHLCLLASIHPSPSLSLSHPSSPTLQPLHSKTLRIRQTYRRAQTLILLPQSQARQVVNPSLKKRELGWLVRSQK